MLKYLENSKFTGTYQLMLTDINKQHLMLTYINKQHLMLTVKNQEHFILTEKKSITSHINRQE